MPSGLRCFVVFNTRLEMRGFEKFPATIYRHAKWVYRDILAENYQLKQTVTKKKLTLFGKLNL